MVNNSLYVFKGIANLSDFLQDATALFTTNFIPFLIAGVIIGVVVFLGKYIKGGIKL